MNWLQDATKHITCPVCGEDVPYVDVSRVPKTCSKSQCQMNYRYVNSHETIQGTKPDYKEVGSWEHWKKQLDR